MILTDFMSWLQAFIPITLLFLAGWVTPGPNTIAVISTSLTSGRQAGVMVALGIASGVIIWAGLAVFGVVLIFELFPVLSIGVKLSGAAYLFWMGTEQLRTAYRGNGLNIRNEALRHSSQGAFRRGIMVIMTNPKAVFFFGSLLTSFVPAEASGVMLGVIVLYSGVFAAVSHSITAAVFSTAYIIEKYRTYRKLISTVLGFLFCVFGLLVIFDLLASF